MIRPLTLLCLVGAAGAGMHVYQTKHSVSLLDRELRGIARTIDEAEIRTQRLQAEWSWLTEQERLRGLAQRHLALEPMSPGQFVRMAEAERRLPAVMAHAGSTTLFAAREPAMAANAPGDATQVSLLTPRWGPAAVQVARAAPIGPPAGPLTAPAALTAPLAAPAARPVAEALPPAVGTAPGVRPATSTIAAVRPQYVQPVETRATEARPAWSEAARVVLPLRQVARPAPRQSPEAAALPPIAAPAPRPATTQVAAVSLPRLPVAATSARAMDMAPPRAIEAAMPLGSMLGNALGSRAVLPPPVAFRPANAASLSGAGLVGIALR